MTNGERIDQIQQMLSRFHRDGAIEVVDWDAPAMVGFLLKAVERHTADLKTANERWAEEEGESERALGQVALLRDALELLVSVQNGPPLPKYTEDWNKAMAITRIALARQVVLAPTRFSREYLTQSMLNGLTRISELEGQVAQLREAAQKALVAEEFGEWQDLLADALDATEPRP